MRTLVTIAVVVLVVLVFVLGVSPTITKLTASREVVAGQIHKATPDDVILQEIRIELRKATERNAEAQVELQDLRLEYHRRVDRTSQLEGKLDGYAIRVPTPTVSIVDCVIEVQKGTTVGELNAAFKAAADGPMKGIFGFAEEPLVSMDYKGDPHSSSVDFPFTMALGEGKSTFIKVVTWYDNEWGYSVRTADLAALMAKSL